MSRKHEKIKKKLPMSIYWRLLKYVKPKPALKVDGDLCVGFRSCMKFGCPSISFKDKKAKIDATLCVGCGVCAQICKFRAIGNGEDD